MATIVITGASSGIGEAAALLLAVNHDVVATVRTNAAKDALERAAADAGVAVRVVLLDVCDAHGVASTFQGLLASGPIDVLLHNAGTGFVGTLEQIEVDLLRSAMEVNYVGAAQVIKAVLPSMRERGQGKVIAVSSVGGAVGQPFNDAYCAAKFALEGLLQSLAPVMATFGVSVSVVEPGPVATKFVANVVGLDAVMGAGQDDPYATAKANYLARLGSTTRMVGMQTSEDVARVLAAIVDEPNPRFRYQTSEWSSAFVATSLADVDGSAVLAMTSPWVTS